VIAATLMCVSLGGCASPTQIVWSAESRSPNGQWVARAYTEVTTGPGDNTVGTYVDLNPINGVPVEVLAFDGDGADLRLKMTWLSTSHFDVLYSEDPRLLFSQVVRAQGIDISVRDEPRKGGFPVYYPVPPNWTQACRSLRAAGEIKATGLEAECAGRY
jgi:hypothetical protein